MMSCEVASSDQNTIIRLGSDIIPLKYHLDLTLDPRSDNFNGFAIIDLKLNLLTQSIVLHAEGLVFDVVYIKQQNRRAKAKIVHLANDGTTALNFDEMLQPGLGQLTFQYHAKFSKGLEGLYKVVDGKQKSLFTQFQAIGARRAFPCFDEPGFKAMFDVTIHAPKNFTAISNTREIAAVRESRNFVGHRFAITKPLPTYLIAFAVGDFDVVIHAPIPASKVRTTPIPLRGTAIRGRSKSPKFALDLTAKLLLVEEKYFGVAYPFDKLDILAVPSMGASGMENAGVIVYDESFVLLDRDSTLHRCREFFCCMPMKSHITGLAT